MPLTLALFRRTLGFASIALLAGCTYGNVGPAAGNGAVATTAIAPTRPPCWSNDDCAANHAGGLCLPEAETKAMSDTEEFLERAMSLHDLITSLGDSSSSSPITTVLQQVRADLSTYSQLAQGRVPPGADAGDGTGVAAQEAPPTREQMQERQDAAWMQSGATQAYVIIRRFWSALAKTPITTDAQKLYADITGLQVDQVIIDLQTFLQDIEVVVAPINQLVSYRGPDGGAPAPRTGAGAVIRYLGPVLEAVNDAVSRVKAFLDPAAISPLKNDLTSLSRAHDLLGKDGNPGACLGAP